MSGLTGLTYCWAWSCAEDEIFWLLAAAANIGYHPQLWRTSVAIALCKPKKPDYSAPRACQRIGSADDPDRILSVFRYVAPSCIYVLCNVFSSCRPVFSTGYGPMCPVAYTTF
ncbi:hypothetical protein BS47DRAFT_1419175 [Hydnum rufescens UP504]|uniref:Uncharacterized protein n=1 Tax=Hydnum rufescens UP504 TaxID=1448309 RepID=A0A9P6AKZ1_9AGAM|nr:hypothetical protein BS47DRAFT_1419175 [Hydnum rufescens UP504]